MLLAGLGHVVEDIPEAMISDPGDYASPLGAIAAARAAGGDSARADNLRARVKQAWSSRPPSQVAARFDGAAVTEDEWWEQFEIAGALLRVKWYLNENNIAAAEQLAREALARLPKAQAIAMQMTDYHLSARNWEQADIWHQAENAVPRARPTSALLGPDWFNLFYNGKRMDAALRHGDIAVARDAVEQTAAAACTLASQSPQRRHYWREFLRRAYVVKAVEEEHLRAEAL